MSDSADFDQLIARIQRELRADRERQAPVAPRHDPVEPESGARRIAGPSHRASVLHLVVGAAVPLLVAIAMVAIWR